jgi:hypothetical protein
MSFDLEVISPVGFPADLGQKICAQLVYRGVEVEIYPSFQSSTWEGGFLPMKVLAMPQEYIGCLVRAPALSGFEVDFADHTASFRSPASRTTTEFALLCLSAAAMAKITGGRFDVPGEGLPASRKDPFEEAIELLKSFVSESTESDFRQYPFERWDPE